MSRLNFPFTFAKIVALFRKMKKKHDDDVLAGGSILTPYLAEQVINLATDNTAVNNAETANNNFEAQEKLMEENTELYHKKYDPIFSEHKNGVQFMKKFYRGSVHKLGDWSVTVNGSKIVYELDINLSCDEIKAFIDKHKSYVAPAVSPMAGYYAEHGINVDTILADLIVIKNLHNAAVAAELLKEEYRESRDNFAELAFDHLLGIGQFVKGFYVGAEHKAGRYGFVIDDSPQKDVERDGVVEAQDSKVLTKLVFGSLLKNTGTIPWKIYKNDVVDGTFTLVNPGDEFKIKWGFGTSTIINENSSVQAKYHGLFSK